MELKIINIHNEWLTNRVEYIGVDNVKSITPFMQDNEVWYHVCYTEPKQSVNAALFK
jgi:hypothetical protein